MKDKIKIIPTATFIKDIKKLNKRYQSILDDLEGLKNDLLENPSLGDDYGSGIHKVRFSIKSKKRGKSGGARVITYKDILVTEHGDTLYLVHIFDKSEKGSVSKQEVISLLKKEGII